MARAAPAALLLAAGCGGHGAPEPVIREAGPLEVGAAEAPLDLPVSAPLGGYTARWDAFGNLGEIDRRGSDYTVAFNPSIGVQTRQMVQAFWFANGQEDLVLLQTDAIYAYDGFLPEIEAALSDATGRDLGGRVILATSHSHSAVANWSAQTTFFLGGDRYDHEVFTRYAASAVDTALAAFEAREPAAVGVGYLTDWDPDDRVFRDRRGDNDDLQVFADIPAGPFKDPVLWMLRVDALNGDPLAVLYGFGIHGIVMDAPSVLISVDAPGHLDLAFQETFDRPVVVAHVQGAGGDASPGGEDGDFARCESVGDRAAPTLHDLWARIPVSGVDAVMETRTRAVRQTAQDAHVTRGGAVDWVYRPWEEGYDPDDVVYDDDGGIVSPIDEFNAEYGAAFCGDAMLDYPEGSLGSEVAPYDACIRVEVVVPVIENGFGLEETPALPLQESVWTTITASLLGPLPTLWPDGSTSEDDLLLATFPGETTAYWLEMFRRRAEAELGFASAVGVGYAQDHEGYLLLAEDWLQAGYEPSINLWGPLQADHIMDASIAMAGALLTDEIEPQDGSGLFGPPPWGPFDLPVHVPDPTPLAGTLLSEAPAGFYAPIYTRTEWQDGALPDLAVPATVPRVQGLVQVLWEGGDPAVDLPRVVLEREEGGVFAEVLTPSGRPVTSDRPEILLAWTPDPVSPVEADQAHRWWAAWQAVGTGDDRAGLPEGAYRLHVTGRRATGGDTWPFETADYEVLGPSFEVVPGTLDVEVSGADLWVSLPGPERGFRHVAEGGSRTGDNPLAGDVAVASFLDGEGAWTFQDLEGEASSGRTLFSGAVPAGTVEVHVTDAYGNAGTWSAP